MCAVFNIIGISCTIWNPKYLNNYYSISILEGGLQQPSSMDYHSSIAGVQDDEDHDDHEDQAIGNRQSVIKFKDIGEEDDREREGG